MRPVWPRILLVLAIIPVVCGLVWAGLSLWSNTTKQPLPLDDQCVATADGAKVVFGPAARPLPQLPLQVDAEGYLVAQSDFTEPVGPSFWERA